MPKSGYKLVKFLFGKYEEIPEDWEIKTLDDSSNILDSKRIPLNSEEREKIPGEIPYYGANGVQGYINKHLFDEDLILLAEDGGYFDEYQFRPIAYFISGKSWVNNHAHILSAKPNNVLKWIFYSLVHKNILPWINGSTRTKLNQFDLKQIQICIPPISEQQKIAAILSSVDDLINKYDEIIIQTKSLKQGLMQTLLTKGIGHKKFKDTEIGKIPDKWEIVSIKDISKVKGGKRLPKGASYSETKTNYPYLRIVDFKDGTVDPHNLEYLTESIYLKIKNYFISSHDVYITIVGSLLGLGGTIPEELDGSILTENAAKLCQLQKINKFYLVFLLNSELCQKQIESYRGNAAKPKLALFRIEKIKIPLPPILEQQKITLILSNMDFKISELESKKSSLEKLKKGLMQKLLTGQIRVKI